MNLIDLALEAGLCRPCFIKTISASRSMLNASTFNQKFQESIQLLGYADKIMGRPLSAFRVTDGDKATLPMSHYKQDRLPVTPVDPDALDWQKWTHGILNTCCPERMAWGMMSFVLYHDRIVIRIYRNSEDHQACRYLRRLVVCPSPGLSKQDRIEVDS